MSNNEDFLEQQIRFSTSTTVPLDYVVVRVKAPEKFNTFVSLKELKVLERMRQLNSIGTATVLIKLRSDGPVIIEKERPPKT